MQEESLKAVLNWFTDIAGETLRINFPPKLEVPEAMG